MVAAVHMATLQAAEDQQHSPSFAAPDDMDSQQVPRASEDNLEASMLA